MDLSKYRQLYVSETQENLEKISQLLVGLETAPGDRRAIDTVFRLVHSIKGMSGTMGYTPVFELAHHLEDLMDRFRRTQVPMTTAAIDVLLAGMDRIGQWLSDVEAEVLPLRADAAAQTLHRRIRDLLEARAEAGASAAALQEASQPATPRADGSGATPTPAGEEDGLPVEPGDIVIVASLDPATPDPGLRGFLLHRKLGELGHIRAARPATAALRLGHLGGPLHIVLRSNLDVSQIEGYLTLVPDLREVRVRRADPLRPGAGTPVEGVLADAPAGSVERGPVPEAASDEPFMLFSDDFAAPGPVPPTDAGALGMVATPAPPARAMGISEFDFEDLLGDTVRELAPPEHAPPSAPRMDAFSLPTGEFTAADVAAAEPEDAPGVAEAAIVRAPKAARSVRVRTDWLDAVLNRTGDLLIIAQRLWTRNQANPEAGMTEALSELSRVLSALHQDALSVRMTPLNVLTARLPRAVRDMARRAGKRAILVIHGDDQHLDRAIIEGLDAPLTHLLSNAVEHGIEAPEIREARGKRPVGTVNLSCLRVRDEIVVEVTDDGGGVDREKLVRRAIEMDLLSPSRAEALAERDLVRLVCLPGLTSRDAPGQNSGRGVGLDAVREMVTALGGALEMHSEPGQGTTIRLLMPRTPGISKLLLVEADTQAFGLPLARILNTGMFDRAGVSNAPERGGGPTVEHDGAHLRLLTLRQLLGFPRAAERAPAAAGFPGVICQGDDGPFVLAVDRVIGQSDAVIKPLGPLLEHIDGLLGVTIDPVGMPVFVIDLLRFVRRAGEGR